ncbi:hypothetical protein AB0F77_28245 [Streptomyces sp. NPDC026672]|uniref:hypothetical protein n=1 Tax=unclassified Streptomyces TaxID=2593676 RepID=UPI0034073EFB
MNHGPDEQGPEGLDSDELDLRRMLHSAVEDIEPVDGTLDHLRRAVPARRARKRQATVGMAAAALFIGTAIPALLHVSHSGGSDPNTSIAGQASQAQGGAGQGRTPGGATGTPGSGDSTRVSADPQGDKKDGDKEKGGGTSSATAGVGNPSATPGTGVPSCTPAQLGSPSASAGTADPAGVVYGTFRVTNVSTTGCAVDGPGTVNILAQGAADQTKLGTARHVAGDAASGLPDPSTEATGLVLQPGAAYEEKFAFVPSETCPTAGGGNGGTNPGGDPSTDPSPSGDPSASGGTSTGSSQGITSQFATADGLADGSVQISHTPAAGAPTAATTVPGVCAGTVYWTGPLTSA